MFDQWNNLTRWLDSAQSDWLWDEISDGQVTTEILVEVLEDFDIPASAVWLRKLYDVCMIEVAA